MPGLGKSGNWRRLLCKLILSLASSAVEVVWEGGSLESWVVASGRCLGGWDEVEGFSGSIVKEGGGEEGKAVSDIISTDNALLLVSLRGLVRRSCTCQ